MGCEGLIEWLTDEEGEDLFLARVLINFGKHLLDADFGGVNRVDDFFQTSFEVDIGNLTLGDVIENFLAHRFGDFGVRSGKGLVAKFFGGEGLFVLALFGG